jgi:hypothetical protein
VEGKFCQERFTSNLTIGIAGRQKYYYRGDIEESFRRLYVENQQRSRVPRSFEIIMTNRNIHGMHYHQAPR